MTQRFFLALGALAASASLLFLGACDGHSWEETQVQHQPHGGHAEHGDADTDHVVHGDPDTKPADDHGDAGKKAH